MSKPYRPSVASKIRKGFETLKKKKVTHIDLSEFIVLVCGANPTNYTIQIVKGLARLYGYEVYKGKLYLVEGGGHETGKAEEMVGME